MEHEVKGKTRCRYPCFCIIGVGEWVILEGNTRSSGTYSVLINHLIMRGGHSLAYQGICGDESQRDEGAGMHACYGHKIYIISKIYIFPTGILCKNMQCCF